MKYFPRDYFSWQTVQILCLLPALTGCGNVAYYMQSAQGQTEILLNSQNIDTVIQQDIDQQTKRKLNLVIELLAFAEQTLFLPNNGSYQQYADLKRPYVIWNVFATPELSLQPKNWCYLIVGCLSYRGYFKKNQALEKAEELKQQGLDVYVGGVAAYSTLGWFKDPVLNTMIQYDDLYLAKIIFHELAHQKWYIKDDPKFNEAFADTIASIGLERWLTSNNRTAQYQQLLLKQNYEDHFVALVLSYKRLLENLYQSDNSDSFKRAKKQLLFSEFKQEYKNISSNWNGYKGFDGWFSRPINNARFSSISTYRELVPDFLAIYKSANQDIETFYEKIESLSMCSKSKRYKILRGELRNWSC